MSATPPFTLPTVASVRADASLTPAQVDVTFPDEGAFEDYITAIIPDKALVVWRNISKLARPYVWPITDELWAAALTGESDADIDDEESAETDQATLATKYRTVAHLYNKAGYYEMGKDYTEMAAAIEQELADAIAFVVGRQEPQAPTTTYSSQLRRHDGYATAVGGTEYSA